MHTHRMQILYKYIELCHLCQKVRVDGPYMPSLLVDQPAMLIDKVTGPPGNWFQVSLSQFVQCHILLSYFVSEIQCPRIQPVYDHNSALGWAV